MLFQKKSHLEVSDAVCMQTNPSSKLTVKKLFAAIYDFSSAFLSEVWNDFVFELLILSCLKIVALVLQI